MRQDLPFLHRIQPTSRDHLAQTQNTSPRFTDGSDKQHDPTKPTYIITLPFELREEIYKYLTLASSFEFLRVCRSINTQAAPLLYK